MKAEDAKKLMDAATQGKWKGILIGAGAIHIKQGGDTICSLDICDLNAAKFIAALPEITNAYIATSALCKKEQKYNDELEQEVDRLKRVTAINEELLNAQSCYVSLLRNHLLNSMVGR